MLKQNSEYEMEATTNKLRERIHSFISERLEGKLEPIEKKLAKEQDEDKRRDLIEKRDKLRADYEPEVWIANAAQLLGNVVDKEQLVTNALKYTHPDAEGTNLYSQEHTAVQKHLIGTHSLQGQIHPDVAGRNAANRSKEVIAVFQFLSLKVNGKALWQYAQSKETGFIEALPGDAGKKEKWLKLFAQVVEPKVPPSSHKLAKQLYWPLPDGSYHLLQPLFPTSLVHAVWRQLREDRFGDAAKAARKARKKQSGHDHGYREWPNLIIQKFGGTKPQNISQLNSERHGEAWLLPSLPPTWQSRETGLPLHTGNAFERFERTPDVRDLLKRLGRYLRFVNDRQWNNFEVRQKRAWYVDELIDQLIHWAAMLQQQPAGWSTRPECRLPASQKRWLDPGAYEEAAEASTTWPRDVAEAFGRWLNRGLRRHKLAAGDDELRAWRKEAEPRLREVLEEMKP